MCVSSAYSEVVRLKEIIFVVPVPMLTLYLENVLVFFFCFFGVIALVCVCLLVCLFILLQEVLQFFFAHLAVQ